MIENVLPLCDQVFFLNPELGHYVPQGTFMPYASAEVESVEVVPPKIDRTPRIVHAPSDGNIKGTKLILEALDTQRSNIDFELILVQNKPHSEVMSIYRDADIAIDQVLAGWYGGFAVEMMAMGKPVMCWIREEDLDFVPKLLRKELPILNVRPDNLVEDIGHVLSLKSRWKDWSKMSRDYVLKWHNPAKVASALIKLYEGKSTVFDLEFV